MLFVNIITISRVVLMLPVFFIDSLICIFFIILWIAISDFLDGFLARKWGVSSTFGAKLDQYSDKLVTICLLMYFFKQNELSYTFVSVILLREVFVLIFRKLKWSNSESNYIGKLKTFFLFILFITLSAQQQFNTQFSTDIKLVIISVVLLSSLLSFFLSITKLTNIIVYFLGTTGFTSLIYKKAPGTISSFIAFLFFFVGFYGFEFEYKIGFFLLLIGFHFSYYDSFLQQINSPNDDPSNYTLDETLAICFAWIVLGDINLLNILILFVLFRFFDILKPLGIQSIEICSNCSASLKNLADDFLAIIYSIFVLLILRIYVG